MRKGLKQYCGSNNIEGINNFTSVVSQKRLVLITKKIFFSYEILFKGQNREAHGPEQTIPHVTDRALVRNNDAPNRDRGPSRFSGVEIRLG